MDDRFLGEARLDRPRPPGEGPGHRQGPRPWVDPKTAQAVGPPVRGLDGGVPLAAGLRCRHRALRHAPAVVPLVARPGGLPGGRRGRAPSPGRVHPTDSWPTRAGAGRTGAGTAEARWVPWAMRMRGGLADLPHPATPRGGPGVRRLGLRARQVRGDAPDDPRMGAVPLVASLVPRGVPPAAEPQIGAVSMATPLVLAFGTTTGLGISADPLPADRRRGGLPAGLALVPRALVGGRGGPDLRPERGRRPQHGLGLRRSR